MNTETKNNILNWFKNDEFEFESEKIISKNKILYHIHICKNAFARIIDNDLYFHINDLNKKAIFKVLKLAENKFENIYFVRYLFREKESYDDFSIHYYNLESMFYHYSRSYFFYEFKKINFDFKKSISKYISKYNIMNILQQVYDDEIYESPNLNKRSGKLLGKKYIYSTFYTKSYLNFNIEDENIRNELYNIDRELKIESILNALNDN